MIEPKNVEDVITECETSFSNHLDYNYNWDTLQLIYALAKEIKNIKEQVAVDD